MQSEIRQKEKNPLWWLSNKDNSHYNNFVCECLKDNHYAAIMLNTLADAAFEFRNELEDGFFYFTQETCKERTRLSREKQDGAIATLVSAGLIEKKLKGVPPKRFFKLDPDVIHRFFFEENGQKKQENPKKTPPQSITANLWDSHKSNCGNHTNQIVGTPQQSESCLISSKSYVKDSKSEDSKEAPPPTSPKQPKVSDQQGLGNSIAPSAISNSDSNPLHEDFEEEDFEPVPRTRKYLTKRELNSPEYKELLELSASGKLKPFFKAHVLKGWIPKWSPYLTLETIHYFLKQHEKQAQTDNPILKPEAWMEDAFKNEYTTQLKIRKQNEEFAKLMKRIHNFHPLEIKAWYCIDTQPGGEDLPYNMPPERFEHVLMRMINRYKEVRSLEKEE